MGKAVFSTSWQICHQILLYYNQEVSDSNIQNQEEFTSEHVRQIQPN